jgi:hypothetical protein
MFNSNQLTRLDVDYAHTGTFDHRAFKDACAREFSQDPRFTKNANDGLISLLGLIEEDPHIADIRWMAYMLATVYWETPQPVRQQVRVLTKKGKSLLDKKGHPVLRSVKRWSITMSPVPEVGHGAGRRYYLPVKVKRLVGGKAQVTEQDGDQFVVSPNGAFTKINKHAKLGANPKITAATIYDEDDGDELSFFGRGYVQLTWWSNYATAGQSINLGIGLLFEPEKVQEPEIAYALMSYGMRTGAGFANGHRFKHYFHGPITNYVGARAMINGRDHRDDIAHIARKFEHALIISKAIRC